ncbi:hypothetical protein PILCRDRAFT_812939 [Piloderma croceum F 1598]|uniref:Uncharacterized protein n=1 Tax=Piloderma croceum (strain F 1598) TaxID=765440 RepID=A0A0C3BRD1_PILCF|nr:hypothetical protein PILCRDRAFT_812939 [Piloderma croceum F 1598]
MLTYTKARLGVLDGTYFKAGSSLAQACQVGRVQLLKPGAAHQAAGTTVSFLGSIGLQHSDKDLILASSQY